MRTRVLAASLVSLVCFAAESFAQYPYARPAFSNPYKQPAYSPYLNLLRPGASPAVNYYGLVRPQLDFQSDITHLGQQNMQLQQNLANTEATTNAIITGNRSSFMNYSRYFMNNGQAGGGGRALTTSFSAPMGGSKSRGGGRGASAGARGR